MIVASDVRNIINEAQNAENIIFVKWSIVFPLQMFCFFFFFLFFFF